MDGLMVLNLGAVALGMVTVSLFLTFAVKEVKLHWRWFALYWNVAIPINLVVLLVAWIMVFEVLGRLGIITR